MEEPTIKESWIEGRRTENEDVSFLEHSEKNIYLFFLPWYACTVPDNSDVFFPLEDRFGKHWYDGYDPYRESLRRATMLEF